MQLPDDERSPFRCTWSQPLSRTMRRKLDLPWFAVVPPRRVKIDGVVTDVYDVRALERVLGRARITLRRWENDGTLPLTPFVVASEHWEGRRRVYPEPLLYDLAEIATRHGVAEGSPPTEAFVKDVRNAFLRAMRRAHHAATATRW